MAQWQDILEKHFPWTSSDGVTTVEFIREGSEIKDGHLWAVIRLIQWDDPRRTMLANIKEQAVRVGEERHLEEIGRWEAFIHASSVAFGEVPPEVDFETFLPEDIVFPEVLNLKAETFDEFGRSLVARSRYGGFSA